MAFSFRRLILWDCHSKNICTHEHTLTKSWELALWNIGSLKAFESWPGKNSVELLPSWSPKCDCREEQREVTSCLWGTHQRSLFLSGEIAVLTLSCQTKIRTVLMSSLPIEYSHIYYYMEFSYYPVPTDFFSPSMPVVVCAMLCILITYCLSWITFFRQVLFWIDPLALLTLPGQIIYFKYFSHSQYSDKAIH